VGVPTTVVCMGYRIHPTGNYEMFYDRHITLLPIFLFGNSVCYLILNSNL
jgi:hypothetical protein